MDIYVQKLKINLHQEALAALTLGDMQLRSDLLNAGTRRAGLTSFPGQPPAK